MLEFLTSSLVSRPMAPACRACVVMPVRNEAELLPAALEALSGQVDRQGRPLDPDSFEVIVLAGNCQDDSAAIARDFAGRRPIRLHVAEVELPADVAHVGSARKLLMDEAARRLLGIERHRGVIASTDGDTRVTPGWLAATLAEIEGGADAVGGRILVGRAGLAQLEPPVRRRYLHDVGYQYLSAELESLLDPDPHDPWPRHFQHTGASLATTAELYLRAGGLPALPSSEDLALYRALELAGARFRHSPAVRVLTSARLDGRAEAGMAAQLDVWARLAGEGQQLVESPAALERRFVSRRRLRALWQRTQAGSWIEWQQLAMTADEQRLAPTELVGALGRADRWGLLVDRLERQVPTEPTPTVEIERAIRELRERLARLRRERSQSNSLEEVEPVAGLLPTKEVA